MLFNSFNFLIFFRATNVGEAWYIANHLFSGWGAFLTQLPGILEQGLHGGLLRFNEALFQAIGFLTSLSRGEIFLTLLALVVLVYAEKRQDNGNFMAGFNLQRPPVRLAYYALLVVAILALGTSYTGIQQAFIYFQF